MLVRQRIKKEAVLKVSLNANDANYQKF